MDFSLLGPLHHTLRGSCDDRIVQSWELWAWKLWNVLHAQKHLGCFCKRSFLILKMAYIIDSSHLRAFQPLGCWNCSSQSTCLDRIYSLSSATLSTPFCFRKCHCYQCNFYNSNLKISEATCSSSRKFCCSYLQDISRTSGLLLSPPAPPKFKAWSSIRISLLISCSSWSVTPVSTAYSACWCSDIQCLRRW